MIEWSEMHLAIREQVQRFVATEIAPRRMELEHGELPPYDILRKLFDTFGMKEMALAQFQARIEKEKARAAAGEPRASPALGGGPELAMNEAAMRAIPIIELCRYSPGMVTALGVSVGLTANAILARGTIAQKERFVPALLTLEKIGAWAITEPGSGSDAFGSMKATARRDGDGYVLDGQKTFITNGPYADTIVFICKLDDGETPPGAPQGRELRARQGHARASSRASRSARWACIRLPTGELFLDDVRVGIDRLIGETEDAPARSSAKETFTSERTGVAAMALGIVEQCRMLCIDYAKTRVQFGKPIGDFQLVQLKLAKMEVARMNLQNLVFRQIELAGAGRDMTLAEASACKLYAAQAAVEVALEAVQLFGGNGYMAEYQVEQLCRDAKVLQIYGGTDEIQISQIARSLLAP